MKNYGMLDCLLDSMFHRFGATLLDGLLDGLLKELFDGLLEGMLAALDCVHPQLYHFVK